MSECGFDLVLRPNLRNQIEFMTFLVACLICFDLVEDLKYPDWNPSQVLYGQETGFITTRTDPTVVCNYWTDYCIVIHYVATYIL